MSGCRLPLSYKQLISAFSAYKIQTNSYVESYSWLILITDNVIDDNFV